MADYTVEPLSALVDGECEAAELDLLIQRLTKDADLRGRWQRYHLISDALKNNIPEAIDVDFSKRVISAIETDHFLQTHSPPSPSHWFKPVAGFALAASLGAVVLIGLRLTQQDKPMPSGSLAVAPLATPRSPDQVATNSVLQSRLNSYLVNHNEYASMNSVHGMLPYARMVGYEPKR